MCAPWRRVYALSRPGSGVSPLLRGPLPRVVHLPRLPRRRHPLRGPLRQPPYLFRRLAAEVGQRIVDPRWDHRLGIPVDQAVAFEGLEGLREHLLADAATLAPDRAPQFAEAVRAVEELDQDQDAPAARHVFQDEAVGAHRFARHHRGAHLSAYRHASTLL